MTPTEVDRTTAVHEMHMKFDEDRTFSSGDMLADRQTDRQTNEHGHHNMPLPYRRRSKQWRNILLTSNMYNIKYNGRRASGSITAMEIYIYCMCVVVVRPCDVSTGIAARYLPAWTLQHRLTSLARVPDTFALSNIEMFTSTRRLFVLWAVNIVGPRDNLDTCKFKITVTCQLVQKLQWK